MALARVGYHLPQRFFSDEGFYARFGKRLLDCSIACLSFVLLSPLFFLIAVLIRLESPGPILFVQERVGRFAQPFKIYKFRTMVADAEKRGPLITTLNDARITRVGRLLRKYKLDEIPQIINIIKGNMSIVGPRPEVLTYILRHREDYVNVLRVRPGLTDYALLSFRNEDEVLAGSGNPEDRYLNTLLPLKIRLYWKYTREISLITDIKIFLKTTMAVLSNNQFAAEILGGRTRFGEIAIGLGYLTQDSIQQALEKQKASANTTSRPIGQILLETGDLRELELVQVLTYQQLALQRVRV
jgi:lipopolysaccharide/colanic/teichoic acid biosynthesis glycosyltransferase